LDSQNQNKITYTYAIDEEEKKNKGLPLYSIIIIIVASMAIIVGFGFLIYKFACRKKKYLIDDQSDNGSSFKNRSKFGDISIKEKSSNRGIRNEVKIIKYEDQK